MKTWFSSLTVLGLFLAVAGAQPEQIIKQRARGVANGNNPVPGNAGAPGTAPASRPAPVATKPNSHQQHIARLKADLANTHFLHAADEPARQEFARNLLAIVQGERKPSTNSVATLANSLLPVLADKKVSAKADERIVQKLVALMNCQGLSASRAQEISGEAHAALVSAGVAEEDAVRVAADLQAVASEIQQPAP